MEEKVINREPFVSTQIVAPHVYQIVFFHPAANSMPLHILLELSTAITNISALEDCKVIILQSAGESAFCGGASFDELCVIKSFDEGVVFFSGFATLINAMRTATAFIITRVQGKAVGGGVGIIAASDFVFALQTVAVKLSELSIGIGPYTISPAVQRKIGIAAFSQLSIDASQWKSSQWAKEKGLIQEIYATTNEMDEAIQKIVYRLSQYDKEAIQTLRKHIWADTDHWDKLLYENAKISANLVLSQFCKDFLYNATHSKK